MAEENARLIQAVFQELHAKSPEHQGRPERRDNFDAAPAGTVPQLWHWAVRCRIHHSLRPDWKSFITSSINCNFDRHLQGRVKPAPRSVWHCIEPPQQTEATIVGDYRMVCDA